MVKKILKLLYKLIPFTFKYFIKDIYLFLKFSNDGAVNIKKIVFFKSFDNVVVLGNGPSLNADREDILSLADSNDFVCVNNFCDDELYVKLKPSLYVFLDAYFFSTKAHEQLVLRREKTFNIINEVTTWNMNIVVPSSADVSILKKIIKNRNITIYKISTLSYFSYGNSKFEKFFFDVGMYGPAQINVLIYGIYLSIIANYKNIKIYGADLSFHNDIMVDQKTNCLYIEYKHFNQKNTFEILRKNPDKVEPWKMAELMKLTSDTFYAHEFMYKYAINKGIHIENASSHSLIDAYPRSKRANCT